MTKVNDAGLQFHQGEARRSVRFRESPALCRNLGATCYEADTLDHLARTHAALGQHTQARRP